MELAKVLHKTTQLLQNTCKKGQVKRFFEAAEAWGRRPEGDISFEASFREAPPVADFMDQQPWTLGKMEFCSSYSILQILPIGRELKLVYTVYTTMKTIWDFCWFQKS